MCSANFPKPSATSMKSIASTAPNARSISRLLRPLWTPHAKSCAKKRRTSSRKNLLQPVVAVPAFAALLLIIAYQNTVTIPQARNTSSRAVAEVYGRSFLLRPSDTRRGNEAIVNETPLEVRPNEGFLLQLDFIPSSSFPAYLCQLQDASGRVLQQVTVPAEKAKQELHLPVPAGLISRPGQYSLVFLGADPVTGKAVNDSKLQYFTFNVAFRQ